MKISSILVTSLLGLSLAHSAFANSMPEHCPDVSAIQGIAFDAAGIAGNASLWTAYVKNNKYGTQDDWSFVLLDVAANNQTEALAKAKLAVTTLSFVNGPFPQNNLWACMYTVSSGESAFTITPPIKTDLRSLVSTLRKN